MKTFKEIDINYYDNSGNVQVRCTVPVTQDALVHYELMQSHYCKLSFKLSRPTYFLLGDFIETPYGRFELIDLTKAKDNDTIGYSYEIQFDAYYRKLKNKILKYRPNTGSQEATFSLTSKISTHIEVIMKNLAYYAKLDKSYLYDPNFEGEGTDYTYVIDASVDANAAKLITYSNSSILDAIANIAQTFGCEWWFEGNILHFGTCENTNAITDFRLNDNIVSMSSSQSQSTYANRVYAFGAARNLPSGYKNDSDADITKDGVVEKRLMLPTSAECSEQNKQMLAENGFELYEIQFDAYYRKLKNKILKYRPNTGSQEATFSLTSKISTHIEVIMKNLAYYAKLDKSYLYDPNFEGEGTDYTYVIDASVDANAAKLITYSNSSILDAIANIAQTFGCEWWFEGNILHFGTCENTNAITDFRLNDNIVSMSSSQSQSTYANRVYAFGAARNLPSGYKNDSDADITKDGVVEKRLMLPTSAECSEQNKQMLAENGFELKNGYIQVGGLREDQYVEGVTTNDDIYPRNLIKTSKVTSYEKDVEDESTPEEGDYIKRTFYRVNSLTIVNEDGEKTGDMAFRKAYILSGKNLHIVFQSGSLNGMDFECEFNPDGVPEILLDDDGNPIFKDGKEQINPKSQVFEIVANEDYGRFLPDITLHPKDGDTFVLYNWDSTKLGDTLVSSASNELLTDSIKDLKKSMIDPTTYTCTAEANYSYNQGRGNLHRVGDRVNLYNKGYGDSYRASRIIGYEFCLDIPYDGAKYYVGEKPSYSRLSAMESKIEELVYNGQSYLNGNGGSGRSIYIIKSYDSITPTDYNVFSAKAVDEQRLNKAKDDIAKIGRASCRERV